MSSKKTKYLNMHDWIGTDPWRRSEISENFQKLDDKSEKLDLSMAAATNTAGQAKATAEGIDAKAESALSNSTAAVTNANTAVQTASAADVKATAAKTTAEDALNKAQSADVTAASVQNQFDQVVINGDSSIEAAQARVDTNGQTYTTLKQRLDSEFQQTNATLAETELQVKEVTRASLKPFFIEYFASFNKFGLGTPAGIANYTGGNYVLTVSGNAGESFVTVISGNIADAGATNKWACVIKNDDGLFDHNKVLSTDGINKVNLLKPLKRNITSGLLGNLHDAALGQHYTELGYFAFAQHLYFSVPRYSERNSVLAQFLEDDTVGKWKTAGYTSYNQTTSMTTPDETFRSIGSKLMSVNFTSAADYAEWQEDISNKKGYLEAFVGCSVGSVRADFYLDDVLVDSKTVNREVERILFPFEYAKIGKIKIVGLGGYPQGLYIGRVTWFQNEKYSKERLIQADMKLAYIGDSWGEYHNKATTRELNRLMVADGGSPTVLDFSKSGHSSTYAKVWFEQHIISNNPDAVIIEYFTNDFNSMTGTNIGTFLDPNGQQQDMNISSLIQYEKNLLVMIDMAIKNGIQPIVVMPASTNSTSQVQSFANKANDLWNGVKVLNDSPYFQTATVSKTVTSSIEANGSTDIIVKGKAANSAVRKGVVIDSDVNLTGGSIQRWSNNGVDKAGVRHDGTIEMKAPKLIPQAFPSANDENSRATITVVNGASTGNIDEFRVVIKLADGTYVQKKLQLID